MPTNSGRDATLNFEYLQNRGLAGPWQRLTLGANVEYNTGAYEPAIRLIAGGAKTEFRGLLKIKAAKEVVAGGELFSIAGVFLPTKTVILNLADISEAGVRWYAIETSGKVLLGGTATKAEHQLILDGLGYSLT